MFVKWPADGTIYMKLSNSYSYVDSKPNTEADLMLEGNILYGGVQITKQSRANSTDWQDMTEVTKSNLLISTNRTYANVLHRYSCLLQISSGVLIWIPDIQSIKHFHQINRTHIVIIPSNQHCLHIYERIFDKLTLRDTIGDCLTLGRRDGPNPLFNLPSHSLSENRNRQLLYVIDQTNTVIRAINILDKSVKTVFVGWSRYPYYIDNDEVKLIFFWDIIQAANSTFYISTLCRLTHAGEDQNTVISMDLQLTESTESHSSLQNKSGSNDKPITWKILIFDRTNRTKTEISPLSRLSKSHCSMKTL